MTTLRDYVDKKVAVISCDGRFIVGILFGFDQAINIILKDCEERIISEDRSIKKVQLDHIEILRGDDIVLIGEFDTNFEDQFESGMKTDPIKPLVH
ncbi:u6 snRNA-associated sm-like protein lsm8 [Anaeramoeba ignava]|uniref:U6 snRNA-associated Sm-like protein LSm8 n=1 Tax=Anaeramoeba ignava TaxID=1746090 RepID=A0A9Q0LYJ3_ANAIG|nr:u6 snRNA-associated sm-like protein lsm8 [Anaeramoeba ignava]